MASFIRACFYVCSATERTILASCKNEYANMSNYTEIHAHYSTLYQMYLTRSLGIRLFIVVKLAWRAVSTIFRPSCSITAAKCEDTSNGAIFFLFFFVFWRCQPKKRGKVSQRLGGCEASCKTFLLSDSFPFGLGNTALTVTLRHRRREVEAQMR